MKNDMTFLDKLAGNLAVAMVVCGIVWFIVGTVYLAIQCGGGSGPNPSLCQ